MIESEKYRVNLLVYKREIKSLKKINAILNVELEARKKEQYWENECITIAKTYGWSEQTGFPEGKAREWRKEMSGRSPYIEIKALREKYVIAKYEKLVDEDTLEEIIDPHDKILHHISSGTYNPRAFCKWDNVKFKAKKKDRGFIKSI